jgi:hypothetical protein
LIQGQRADISLTDLVGSVNFNNSTGVLFGGAFGLWPDQYYAGDYGKLVGNVDLGTDHSVIGANGINGSCVQITGTITGGGMTLRNTTLFLQDANCSYTGPTIIENSGVSIKGTTRITATSGIQLNYGSIGVGGDPAPDDQIGDQVPLFLAPGTVTFTPINNGTNTGKYAETLGPDLPHQRWARRIRQLRLASNCAGLI